MNRSERRKVGKTQKEDVDHLVEEGLSRMREGQFGSARSAFREVISVQPNNGEALYRLGTLSFFAGEMAQAEDLYRRAIVARPGFAGAYSDLGFLLQQTGKFDEALTSIQSAIEIDATRPEFYVNLAATCRHLKHLDGAIAACDKALEVNPKHSQALFFKGMNDISRDDKAAAIVSFKSALESDPYLREAYMQLATLEYDPEKKDSHLTHYKKAFDDNPEDIRMALSYVEALHKSGCYKEAESILRKFEGLEGPGSLGVANGLGHTLASQGKLEEAIPFHKKALQIENDDAVSRQNYGLTLIKQGQYSEAKKQLQKAWQRSPYSQDLVGTITTMLRAANDPQANIFTNPDLLIFEDEIDLPQGYESIESFNDDLWAHIETLEAHPIHPFDRTRKIGETVRYLPLDHPEEPVLSTLRSVFDASVTSFEETLPDNKSHPFLSRKGWGRSSMHSFVIDSKEHDARDFDIEQSGYMKGIYFISAPDECADDSERNGWLRFGKPTFDLPAALAPEIEIRPEAGKMVLFPAYFWHGFNALKAKTPMRAVTFHVVANMFQ